MVKFCCIVNRLLFLKLKHYSVFCWQSQWYTFLLNGKCKKQLLLKITFLVRCVYSALLYKKWVAWFYFIFSKKHIKVKLLNNAVACVKYCCDYYFWIMLWLVQCANSLVLTIFNTLLINSVVHVYMYMHTIMICSRIWQEAFLNSVMKRNIHSEAFTTSNLYTVYICTAECKYVGKSYKSRV